ncbi:uncharacterized protein ACA1_034600 [Acanthamoeba castellanii str. Neff]|uniref:STEEP1 domain-containing protein n=1 Tax=Acanthamoeba castellanii (strain ATCC 30010 / Neff) TaxID=1257118 RepID=L8HBQ7_ACACF|nr:uncharacterized protein ACA1_034600 [Acanthamoeba castellanii str. Neff]ELR22615.1 hypothetical protein ACA1_034600 [Acanthamoeba castellanii str. Neff]
MDNDGRASGGSKRKERDAASSRGTYSSTRSKRESPSRDAKKARPSSTATSTSGERRREGDEDDSSATATAILLQSERQIERETLRTIEKIVTRYHCALCHKPLEGLPRRKTDESYVINKDKALYKLTIVPGEKVSIKRDKGVEVQYSSAPQHGAAQYTYILKDALVPAAQVPVTERRGGGAGSWRSKEESQFLAATTKGEFTLACCSLHNKTRSVRHLERMSGERWTCKAGHKCL